MRLRLAVLLVTALGLVVAPSASSDPPLHIPIVIEPLTLTGVCDFPVLLEAVGPQHQKIIVFSNGRVTVNGQLFTRATNLDDPSKVWEHAASGPIFLDPPMADGSTRVTGTGTNLWFFFPGQVSEGAPGALYWVRGLSTEIIDADGVPVTGTFEHRGAIENLCETLA